MSKKTSYFSHDSNARNDEKMLAVRMRHNAEGYGIYFMLIERLRDESDYTSVKDYNMIAFDLRVSAEKVKSIVEDFGLFDFSEDGKRFFSDSLMRRMEIKDESSSKRSEAGKKGMENRWKNKKDNNVISENNNVITNDQISITSKVKKEKKDNTPLPPEGNESEKLVWKKDFNVYLKELREQYKILLSDKDWIAQQEKFNPGVNILKSIEKCCVNYWATEAGWKKKKSSKIKDIDWKATFANAVSLPQNRVYNDRFNAVPNEQVLPKKAVKPEKW